MAPLGPPILPDAIRALEIFKDQYLKFTAFLVITCLTTGITLQFTPPGTVGWASDLGLILITAAVVFAVIVFVAGESLKLAGIPVGDELNADRSMRAAKRKHKKSRVILAGRRAKSNDKDKRRA